MPEEILTMSHPKQMMQWRKVKVELLENPHFGKVIQAKGLLYREKKEIRISPSILEKILMKNWYKSRFK